MTTVERLYQQDYGLWKHSGLGIASFVVSLLIGASEFLLIMIAGVLEAATPGGMDNESLIVLFIGLFVIVGLFANLAGVGLGIAGLVQRDRKKVFSALGVVFNGTVIFGLTMLLILGASMP
jgi:hypothetical protein